MILLQLFLSFFRIALFAIGGAYSFLPLLEREIVEKYHWLSKDEFLDVLGIVRVFPGAISIKYATYTGYKMAGVWGAVVTNLGNLLAPMIFVLFALGLYSKYKNLPGVKGAFNAIQLTMFALIIAVAFQLVNINHLIHFRGFLIILVSFALFLFTKIHPALIIILSGIIGIFIKL